VLLRYFVMIKSP